MGKKKKRPRKAKRIKKLVSMGLVWPDHPDTHAPVPRVYVSPDDLAYCIWNSALESNDFENAFYKKGITITDSPEEHE